MATVGYDLTDAAFQGLIHEDVMNKIWDISRIPLPLSDRIGSDSHGNSLCEWTVDRLAAPATDNAQEDGADTNTIDDTVVGSRKGNYSQLSVKVVKVGTRARNMDGIGFSDNLSYQVMQRQRELRRDVEATMLTSQASVRPVSGTAGTSAGLGAWCLDQGTTTPGIGTSVANGTTEGGWQTTGVVTARTGAADASDVALTETAVRSVIKAVYENGGEATVMMSTPSMIEGFSNYLFTSSARVAALQSDINQQRSAVTATGAVNVFVSDFGTVELVSNRLQQVEGTATAVSCYILDPTMLRLSYLSGYRTEPLAKTGLADTRQMCVDWSLKVLNEEAQGGIFNVDQTAPVTA